MKRRLLIILFLILIWGLHASWWNRVNPLSLIELLEGK